MAEYRQRQADCYINLGIYCTANNEPGRAIECYRQAIALQAKLAEQYPGTPDYRGGQAGALHNLGLLLGATDKTAAIRAFREAQVINGGLITRYTEVLEYKIHQGGILNDLGEAVMAQGQAAEARGLAEEAIRLQQSGLALNPQ